MTAIRHWLRLEFRLLQFLSFIIVIMSKDEDEIKSKLLVNGNQEKDLIDDEEDESKKLLLPRKGGLSTNSANKHHKVQWNDNNLTQVLEYQPSEASDVDEEDSDACICNIM